MWYFVRLCCLDMAAPVLARVEAKAAVLRWYHKEPGVHKYILQQRFIECLDNLQSTGMSSSRASKAAAFSGDDGWEVVYEGPVSSFRDFCPRCNY